MESEITVQWYTVEYPLPEEDEEDYCPDSELVDEGTEVFDEGYIDSSLVAQVAEYLCAEGAVYPSANCWYAGIWYKSDLYTRYCDGVTEESTYHLQDVSDRTSQEVWALVTRRACVWHPREEEESELAV